MKSLVDLDELEVDRDAPTRDSLTLQREVNFEARFVLDGLSGMDVDVREGDADESETSMDAQELSFLVCCLVGDERPRRRLVLFPQINDNQADRLEKLA